MQLTVAFTAFASVLATAVIQVIATPAMASPESALAGVSANADYLMNHAARNSPKSSICAT
ncbi:uncharacterized protein TRAVEDRAFT_50963 [Trametes versicolor FP-101664 SS1]|uniref:uncharacterized protein n=1 Tax=Trametes versicolor (strain FP-101664) TaxID=717944 RepID=UPI0004621CFC|nr:uncharacterized protein TRAVEDRAFT_50963 [Trametes versicolor FP-101664 SS1]EIW54826.1 hypothetical protein TRAVEDRAFT_50963 [Trametes versicolor FP-101664 SS1]